MPAERERPKPCRGGSGLFGDGDCLGDGCRCYPRGQALLVLGVSFLAMDLKKMARPLTSVLTIVVSSLAAEESRVWQSWSRRGWLRAGRSRW